MAINAAYIHYLSEAGEPADTLSIVAMVASAVSLVIALYYLYQDFQKSDAYVEPDDSKAVPKSMSSLRFAVLVCVPPNILVTVRGDA